jgi:hypothetical protein
MTATPFLSKVANYPKPVLIRIRSATIQHRAWTDARRRDSLRTVLGGFSYCRFDTENWLYSVDLIEAGDTRLTVRIDSKHAVSLKPYEKQLGM